MVDLDFIVVLSLGQVAPYYYDRNSTFVRYLTDAIYEWYSTNYPDLTGTVLENGGTEDG